MMIVTNGRTILQPALSAPKLGLNQTKFLYEQKRYYHEIKVGMFGLYPKTIATKLDAKVAIEKLFSFGKTSGFLAERPGCLSIVTFPEFAFNRASWAGHQIGSEAHTAATPLEVDLFKELVAIVRQHASALPGGFLFTFGGIAVDTGEKLESGKIRALNLGFLVESGPMADCVLYSKVHHDPVDQWDTSKYEPSLSDEHVGPLTRTIKDPYGGRSAIVTLMICADMEVGPFPTDMSRSDVVICSSAGAPPFWQKAWLQGKHISEHATVAVNESSSGELVLTGPTGVTEVGQVPVHPWLTGLHSMASWAGFGEYLLAAYEVVLGVQPTEALAMQMGFTGVETTIQKEDGLKLVTAGPRPLLPELTDK